MERLSIDAFILQQTDLARFSLTRPQQNHPQAHTRWQPDQLLKLSLIDRHILGHVQSEDATLVAGRSLAGRWSGWSLVAGRWSGWSLAAALH
jgi:hypothetical protein